MLRCQTGAAAYRGSEGNGKSLLSTKHIMDLAGLIDDLIHGNKTEGDHVPINNGPHSRSRRTYRDAGEGILGDRCSADARFSEFLHQGRWRIRGQMNSLGVPAQLLGQSLHSGMGV